MTQLTINVHRSALYQIYSSMHPEFLYFDIFTKIITNFHTFLVNFVYIISKAKERTLKFIRLPLG